MIADCTVGVIVPAYNEELLIGKVVSTMPRIVKHIVIVNDASSDATCEEARLADEFGRVRFIQHETNMGLGQSLIDGYREAEKLGCNVVAVMAGDAQMSPDDLESVIKPVVEDRADYVKGNRLLRPEVVDRMPRHRLIGNALLTFLSKFAHGYWHSMDPQCGYTAVSAYALRVIPLESMVRGYGYNADLLNMLNIANLRVAEVQVEPVYGEETSYIKLWQYAPRISVLLVRLFSKRIFRKYVLLDFHPLALMYGFSILIGVLVLPPLFLRLVVLYLSLGVIPTTTLLLLSFSAMFTFMSLFFAMWLDMEDNRRLWVESRPIRSYKL
jgi:glycosyltransferase involved in cell wall biosynthesis